MTTTERKLDARRSLFRPRMLDFNVAAVLPTTAPRNYTWGISAWYDQGQEGACVPHAFAHEAAAKPVVRTVPGTDIWAMYDWCRRNDPWPGEDYDGTSVDAGARAARQWGYLGEWRWAANVEDSLVALGRKGAAVWGTDWWTGMFNTDSNGYLRRTGSVAGGHAILLHQVSITWQPGTTTAQRTRAGWLAYADRQKSYVGVHNSWGRDWGRDGKARLTLADYELLFDAWGEVCIPTRRI